MLKNEEKTIRMIEERWGGLEFLAITLLMTQKAELKGSPHMVSVGASKGGKILRIISR